MSNLSAGAKIRRTLELYANTVADLAKIKSRNTAKNDTAVINEAISFRAQFLDHDVDEIHRALIILDEVNQMTDAGATLVTKTVRGLRIEPADGLLKEEQPEGARRVIGTFLPNLRFG